MEFTVNIDQQWHVCNEQKVAVLDLVANGGVVVGRYDVSGRGHRTGTFYAPPAQVYLMYAPEVWGRSDSSELVFDEGR
jgi:uncharacterized protein YfaS (alpha-2-macroglobulin family)